MQGRKNKDNTERYLPRKSSRQTARRGTGLLIAGTLVVCHHRKINDDDEGSQHSSFFSFSSLLYSPSFSLFSSEQLAGSSDDGDEATGGR